MIDFCERTQTRLREEGLKSQLTQRPRGAGEERRGGSDVVEKPVAVANSGQWPSGVQRVHSGLVLLVVVVVSCSVARCGACCPAPLAPAEWNPPDTVLCCFYSWNRLVARSICESDITLTLDQLKLIRWRMLYLRGKGWYRCLQEKHQMWAVSIILQHQNKIRQRNLPRFNVWSTSQWWRPQL